ncbi:hypothetical protein RQP46_010720 [Phenoliferia psychrophenolica]
MCGGSLALHAVILAHGRKMASPARATFSSLPIELKANIVLMVHEQDLALARFANEAEEPYVLGVRNWDGPSLLALSVVCRELNKLTAVHIFDWLSSDHAGAPSSFFQLRILPRHASHFRSFEILETDGFEVLRKAFALIGFLPNLDELSLGPRAAEDLFGPLDLLGREFNDGRRGSSTEEEQRLARETLRLRSRDFKILNLFGFRSQAAAQVLAVFPNLHTVTLRDRSDSRRLGLPDGLAQYDGLKKLVLLPYENDASLYLTADWAEAPWSEGQLDSLRVFRVAKERATFDFIDAVASTLSTLTITVSYGEQDPTPDQPILRQPFPSLRHFTLHNSSVLFATSILSSFATSILSSFATKAPSLITHCDLLLHFADTNPLDDDDAEAEAIVTALRPYASTLQCIAIVDIDTYIPADIFSDGHFDESDPALVAALAPVMLYDRLVYRPQYHATLADSEEDAADEFEDTLGAVLECLEDKTRRSKKSGTRPNNP